MTGAGLRLLGAWAHVWVVSRIAEGDAEKAAFSRTV